MDLRPYLIDSPALLEQGIELVRQRKLWYQPFILADGLEVGEGQNLEDRYQFTQSYFDNNVFASDDFRHLFADNGRKLADDEKYFAFCNRKYQLCYDRIADDIVRRCGGDISRLSFLEVGCNSGLLLFCLALRGAGRCTGIDWTDHGPVVDWLNRVLGTDVKFSRGTYDNVFHDIDDAEVLEHDVVLNTVFVNHQCDPIQFISYLADRARKGLFLWVLLDEQGEQMAVNYGRLSGMHKLGSDDGRAVPLIFHNDVKPTTALFRHILPYLGFERTDFIDQPVDRDISPPAAVGPFQMAWAERTNERRSALWPRQYVRAVGPLASLNEWQDISHWHPYNIGVEVADDDSYAPTPRVVRLVEDSQKSWRNIQTIIAPARRRIIEVTADIKLEADNREVTLMVYAGDIDRFSVNFDPVTQRMVMDRRGGGVTVASKASAAGNNWWQIRIAGYLSQDSAHELVYLGIAMTSGGLDGEEYQGDGRSSVAVGKVTLLQQTI